MRKITVFFIILAAFALYGAIPVCAAGSNDIEIRVNGVTLAADTMPVIRSDRVYAPLRAIAESLSYNVDYNDATRTATISNNNTIIQISLNGLTATLNGEAVQMPAPALNLNGRIMVPVRFITESFDCLVNWTDYGTQSDGPRGLVDIYGGDPTSINGSQTISSVYYTYSKPIGDPDGHMVTCNYAVPQIHGLKDKGFEASFNKSFRDKLDRIKQTVSEGEKDAIASAADANAYAYDFEYDGGYTCSAIGSSIITISLNDYIYSGGAHGMPYKHCNIIDVNKSKALTLHDVLKPGQASEAAVVKTINALAAASPDDYGLFSETNTVTADEVFRSDNGTEKTGNFYFEGGSLVIFFQPYEIGPYSMGFITFKIPAGKIADYIQPEYLQIMQ